MSKDQKYLENAMIILSVKSKDPAEIFNKYIAIAHLNLNEIVDITRDVETCDRIKCLNLVDPLDFGKFKDIFYTMKTYTMPHQLPLTANRGSNFRFGPVQNFLILIYRISKTTVSNSLRPTDHD